MVNIYQSSIDYLASSPTIIQLSWGLSGIFTFTIFGLALYLKYLRGRLRNKERIQQECQKKYEADLITYLYSGNNEEEITPEQQQIILSFIKYSESSLQRKLVLTTLLKLKNEISGEMSDAIQKLYYQTGLINYAATKLKSKKWDVIAKGIKELAQFEIKEMHDEIILQINHPKKEVRREIQMYLVKLFHFEGLDFLNVITTQLSEWEQIQLLEILQNFDNQKIPDITNWLESSNNSVTLFALKLAKIYNLFEVKDVVITLLNHPETTVRLAAINVLTHMGDPETVEILKNDYQQRDIEEQIEFLKMMEIMAVTADSGFIMQLTEHTNFEIRVSAMKILKRLDIDEANKFKITATDSEIPDQNKLIKAS